MERGSRSVNLEFPIFDFDEVELIDNRHFLEKYQPNETSGNFTMGILGLGSPSGSSPPLKNQPNSKHKPSASSQINECASLSVNIGRNLASSGTSPAGPIVREATKVQKTVRASSNQNLMQPACLGFEDNDNSSIVDSSHGNEIASPPFSPLIMERTQSFPLALAEKLPLHGSYEHGQVNSVQANRLNSKTGSSLHQRPQWVEPVNQGRGIMVADQFEQNNGNNNFNGNQQALRYQNLLPQIPSGNIGFLNAGSTQINQPAPNCMPSPLAPSGPQVNPITAINSPDPLLPRPSAPLRPMWSNNQLQSNEIPNMPNASDSLCQPSALTKHSVAPMKLMPQNFSYQHNQVQMAPGAYNSQTLSSILLECSMSRRTQIQPPVHQINPLDVSDLQCRNSMHPKESMLSSGEFNSKDLSDQLHQHHQYDQPKLRTNQFDAQYSNSMPQESLIMPLGSHPLQTHQPGSNHFPMTPSLPNSELPETSALHSLPTVQAQGLANQTARPIPTNPASWIALSSLGLNTTHQQETGGISAPYQMELSLSSEQGIPGQRGLRRNGFEGGQSSSFKRFRRESPMPQASGTVQVEKNYLSLLNEVPRSNIDSLLHERPFVNAVYDRKYEQLGLAIDPHLRLFAKK